MATRVLGVTPAEAAQAQGRGRKVGYDRHDADNVNLYLEESFTSRANTPEAAVVLTP